MNSNKIRIITRTAILLAIAVTFQLLGRSLGPYNNYIVGPVVNAVLFVSASITGLWGGAAISVLAPLISALTNKAMIAPIIFAFSPFIAISNFIIVLGFYFLRKKSQIIGVGVASVAKFIFLFLTIRIFVDLMAPVLEIQRPVADNLILLFSWSQLLTAIIGGVLAIAVLKVLNKSINKT